MNDRYREAAESCRSYAVVAKQFESAIHPPELKWPATKKISAEMELAALILSKLATGEWVLCEKRESMRDSYNGGESYTYYVPVELP